MTKIETNMKAMILREFQKFGLSRGEISERYAGRISKSSIYLILKDEGRKTR